MLQLGLEPATPSLVWQITNKRRDDFTIRAPVIPAGHTSFIYGLLSLLLLASQERAFDVTLLGRKPKAGPGQKYVVEKNRCSKNTFIAAALAFIRTRFHVGLYIYIYIASMYLYALVALYIYATERRNIYAHLNDVVSIYMYTRNVAKARQLGFSVSLNDVCDVCLCY